MFSLNHQKPSSTDLKMKDNTSTSSLQLLKLSNKVYDVHQYRDSETELHRPYPTSTPTHPDANPTNSYPYPNPIDLPRPLGADYHCECDNTLDGFSNDGYTSNYDFTECDGRLLSDDYLHSPSSNCSSEDAEIFPPSDSNQTQAQSVFMEAFIQNNRLEHVSQMMGYHPNYLRNFLDTQNFLLREDGPLPYEYRHYIAIMAASRHHCIYLVKQHQQEFLMHNGNPEWLQGIKHAPRKLQDLYHINKILAHRPWLISKDHMQTLLKSSEPWSLSELMQAIILLTHFHSLCTFVYGCGISAEEEVMTLSPPPSPPQTLTDTTNHACNGDVEISSPKSPQITDSRLPTGTGLVSLMEKMKELKKEPANLTSPEELLKRFHSVENQSVEISVPSITNTSPKAETLRFVIDPDFCYTDFASREHVSEVPTFKAGDYSWEDHGFSLANRLYQDVGNMLDDKFSLAANLTYYTMGDMEKVDTSSFRRAIWNYIHSMYGIRHDDYDYYEVNQLLERNLKSYFKTLTCYPERITKKEFDGVMREFKPSEKVHINLMLMEARQQAELLYALRALSRYMT